MPQLYFAGGGWVAVVLVGVAGLLLSTVFITYKKGVCNNDYESNLGDDLEMNYVEVNDDHKKTREETKYINSSSESDPIMQSTN